MLEQLRAAFIATAHPLSDEQFVDTAHYAHGEITHDELMGTIANRYCRARPVAQLAAPDEETVELEGDESCLSTVDEPGSD